MTDESQASAAGMDRAERPATSSPSAPEIDLWLPAVEEHAEPAVFFLDGEEPRAGAPLDSPTLAALYAGQGVDGFADAGAETPGDTGPRLEGWLTGLRDARAVWLRRWDGASPETQEAVAPRLPCVGEQHPGTDCAAVLRAAGSLARQLGGGCAVLSLASGAVRMAVALLPDGRAVGIEGGPDALIGQLRGRVREAAVALQGASR